jgi:4-hydroxybenzoyl-CoA thioesterase
MVCCDIWPFFGGPLDKEVWNMPFQAHLKVCFSDIDNAGIVYYPRFVHYFHVALEDFFSMELGVNYSMLLQKHRIGFPTVHLETDFRRKLRYGDHLIVEVRVLKLGNTSITWGYKVYRAQEPGLVVTEGQNTTVCMNIDTYEKQGLPSWLRILLENYQEKCDLLEKAAEDPYAKV